MIRLVDLAPVWLLSLTDRVIGIRLDCPCCRSFRIAILFSNPPDGGRPLPATRGMFGDRGGLRFDRSGETFETLTIDGLIPASEANHWSGLLTDGEVSP